MPETAVPTLLSTSHDEACEAARLARSLARRYCLPSEAGDAKAETCAGYHALYPTLRLVSLAASPDRHSDFFASAFGEIARAGDSQSVLITGTADSGILEHLLLAWYRAGVRAPAVSVLDLCETPLRLCEWFGERLGVPIRMLVGDVLEHRVVERYDLVCTHSFIVKFDDDRRAALFAKWAELVRPGGHVITTVRVDADRGRRTIAHTEEQAAAFEARVLEAVEPWLARLEVDESTLRKELAYHARAVVSVPVASPESLRHELETAGFEVERLDLVDRGSADASLGGAGGERRATYADFVARRRV